MRIHARLIVSFAALMLTGQASATVVNTFQFVDNGGAWTGYGVTTGAQPGTLAPASVIGNSATYYGSQGLKTTAYFYSGVPDNGDLSAPTVTPENGWRGHGISVGDYKLDYDGEAIEFRFDDEVEAKSSFYYAWDDYTDVGVFYWDSGTWTSLVSKQIHQGYEVISLENTVSNRFLFVNIDAPNGNDTWVFKGLAVATINTITNVPEPGIAALLTIGFAVILFGRRRRSLKV